MTTLLAITFDWYGTLATHRTAGRGRQFRAHLASKGLEADPWDRKVLYELFDYYAEAYIPKSPDRVKQSFWIEFTRLLFNKSNVRGAPNDISVHADAIRDIFGSTCFELFPEVKPLLADLKRRGLRLGVISNWPRGLHHFCEELEIAKYFDAIISSADVGYEKPDARIFKEALRRLQLLPEQTLHVGDSMDEDFKGATEAGLGAILLDRTGVHSEVLKSRVRNLDEIESILRGSNAEGKG